jgi:hypothetical protein
MRRRMVARTAVVGGTAYYAVTRGSRAGQQEPEQEVAYDEAPPPQSAGDPVAEINELNELREEGILTEEEFAAEKKKPPRI